MRHKTGGGWGRRAQAVLLVLGFLSATADRPATARTGLPEQDQRLSGLIDQLNTRNWDKAVEALAGIGEPAVGPLIEALDRSERFLPGRACVALARIGTPRAIEAVYGALNRPGIQVKSDVIEALGTIRTPRAEALLIGFVKDPSQPQLRHFAARALAGLGSAAAVGPITGLLDDGLWYNRMAAAQALGILKAAGAVGALIKTLGDGQRSVRVEARTALAAIGSPAVGPVSEALASGRDAERWPLVWILRRIGSPETVLPLLHRLRDEDPLIRAEAALALAGSGDVRVDGLLLGILDEGGPAARREAAWVLGSRKAESAVGPLTRLLADRESGSMAALALGKIASPAALRSLAEALAEGPVNLRRAAALALARAGSRVSPDVMKRALRDADAEVRFWAGSALRSLERTVDAAAPAAKLSEPGPPSGGTFVHGGRTCALYPALSDARPDLPSPLRLEDGREVVTARTQAGRWGIVPVTLDDGSRGERQLRVDADDFRALAETGLHSEIELDQTRTITGRSVGEISDLARPGALSDDGFLAVGESVLEVMARDNRTVSRLGLRHPDLARPLFHVWNMIRLDLDLGFWNMAEHRWENIAGILYNGHEVRLDAADSKGGQESIFADGLGGGFTIRMERDVTADEEAFLAAAYGRLSAAQREAMKARLSRLQTGEMEAFYVMGYGFYEGNTPWRVDPLALAFIFGLRSLAELEKAFPGRLFDMLAGPVED